MLGFKQFLSEKDDYDPWSDIDKHDRATTGEIADHVTHWTGMTHKDVEDGAGGGIMLPRGLEQNWKEVHSAAQPIRDALRKKHGNYIMAYRATHGAKQSGAQRMGNLHSYTTNRKVALAFAGAPRFPRRPLHTQSQIDHHQAEIETKGITKVGSKTFKKNGNYIDVYSGHDEDNFDYDIRHMRDHFESQNNYIRERNREHDEAEKRVKMRAIPVDRVVWATDRANQKELIVASNRAWKEKQEPEKPK
jgi:hypothetical protein